MIDPDLAFIIGQMTCLVTLNTLFRLTLMTSSHCSGVRRSNRLSWRSPQSLTQMSIVRIPFTTSFHKRFALRELPLHCSGMLCLTPAPSTDPPTPLPSLAAQIGKCDMSPVRGQFQRNSLSNAAAGAVTIAILFSNNSSVGHNIFIHCGCW